MIDDWVELEAPSRPAVNRAEPVTIAVARLRHGAEKVSLSIDERVMSVIGWPRYRVQWNRDRKTFRIQGDPGGGFEGFHPPRGPKAGEGCPRRIVIRIPRPDDLAFAPGRHAAVHEVQGAALLVRVPSRFWVKKP